MRRVAACFSCHSYPRDRDHAGQLGTYNSLRRLPSLETASIHQGCQAALSEALALFYRIWWMPSERRVSKYNLGMDPR